MSCKMCNKMFPNVGPKECTLYIQYITASCKICGNKFFERNPVGGGGLLAGCDSTYPRQLLSDSFRFGDIYRISANLSM